MAGGGGTTDQRFVFMRHRVGEKVAGEGERGGGGSGGRGWEKGIGTNFLSQTIFKP